MRRTNVRELTKAIGAEFLSEVEGCIPDLFDEADSGDIDMSSDEARENIHAYVADQACDAFPNVEASERHKLVDSVVTHFCGRAL